MWVGGWMGWTMWILFDITYPLAMMSLIIIKIGFLSDGKVYMDVVYCSTCDDMNRVKRIGLLI